MHEPTYREALKQSWYLTWNHKILWIYGLLAILLGPLGLGDFIGRILHQSKGNLWPKWISIFQTTDLSSTIGIIWITGIFLSLALVFLLSGVIAQGALIQSSAGWYQKKKIIKSEKLWNTGVHRFWPLLLANFVRHILLCLILFSMAYLWVVPMKNPTFLNSFLIIIILTIELFIAMIIYSVFIYTAGYIVIDKQAFLPSLKKGLKLFSNHLLVSLELSLIIMAISVGLTLTILIFSTIFLLPSLLIWLIASFTGYYILVTIGAILGYVAFILLIALSGAIFNAFAINSWTYLFIKMHKEGIGSRLFHYFGKIFKK